jgi:hypothetical protein
MEHAYDTDHAYSAISTLGKLAIEDIDYGPSFFAVLS